MRDASYYGGVASGIVSTVPMAVILVGLFFRGKTDLVHPARLLFGTGIIGAYCWNWDKICDYGSHFFMLRKMPLAFNCFLALPKDCDVYKKTVELIEHIEDEQMSSDVKVPV